MELGLKGKVAAITGGSDGIGFAAASRLLQEGARVAICARRAESLRAAGERLRAAGGDVLEVVADVTRAQDVQGFIDATAERYGGLDILVNNAGTASAFHFADADDAAWQADFDLKVHAAIRAARAALPHLTRSLQPRIINVTTWGGKQPGPRSVPTSVSRAAGIALTKALSKDLAANGILVNTVCVGVIKSGQQRALAVRRGLSEDAYYQELARQVPLGRVGEADEAGAVIAFLASAAASYVTGASINIDGGAAGVV